MRRITRLERMRSGTVGVVFAALGLLAGTAAIAQTASPDKAPSSLQDGGDDNLSTKLSRSGGVITPKSDVDPGIGKSAPDPRPNSTPVIPPSANGGGSAK